jgi:hypothetical protein
MVPKKSLLLAGAALALFGATTSAQSKMIKNLNKPLRSAYLDLASGTITRGAIANNRGATTVQDFANGDARGIGVDTGNGACEWFARGVKGYNNVQSDLMANIRIVYCSDALDVLSGGEGGTTKLGFYENHTLGGGEPQPERTQVVAFTVTGLPANTSTACFLPWAAGTTGCWVITLGFGTQICFADGPIGYSWKFVDIDPCGPWSHTFPFLACVTSCSTNPLPAGGNWPANAFPPDGQGMTDFVDQYCPPGFLLSTFSFATLAGVNPMLTSINMRIRECSDFTATVNTFNATLTPNTDQLSATTAVLGSTWTATTTRVGGVNGFWSLRINDAKGTPNGVKCSTISLPSATGRNLLGGNNLVTFSGSIVGTTGATSQAIPCDPTLVGFYWTGQSLVAAGTALRRCTWAVEGTVGTF